MTVEVKNLEADFIYIKDECVEDKDKAGSNLRVFGRRLLSLADEFLSKKINSTEWKKYQVTLKSSNCQPKISSNSKTNYKPRQKNTKSSPKNTPSPPPPNQSSITKATTIKNNKTQNDTSCVHAGTMKIPALRV